MEKDILQASRVLDVVVPYQRNERRALLEGAPDAAARDGDDGASDDAEEHPRVQEVAVQERLELGEGPGHHHGRHQQQRAAKLRTRRWDGEVGRLGLGTKHGSLPIWLD